MSSWRKFLTDAGTLAAGAMGATALSAAEATTTTGLMWAIAAPGH